MKEKGKSDMRNHGGKDWIDLSTTINRNPWPGHRHGTSATAPRLREVAADWFACDPAQVLPLSHPTGGIEVIAHLLPAGRAAVRQTGCEGPASILRAAGWQVGNANLPRDLHGAELAVIGNPVISEGRAWLPGEVAALAGRVGHLIVDERLADPRPDLSIIPTLPDNVTVLRSLDRFWGLSGLPLGLVIGRPKMIALMAARAGSRAAGGPAQEIGAAALADREWITAALTWLAEAALHLDQIMLARGCGLVGGTHLFRLYDVPDAAALQRQLARHRIRGRIFTADPHRLRLAPPGSRAEFDRLREALA